MRNLTLGHAGAAQSNSSSSESDTLPESSVGCFGGAGKNVSPEHHEHGDTLLSVDEDEDTFAEFKKKHSQFWKDCRLSFFVGIWMMVFGAFSYMTDLRRLTFGDESVCKEKDVGLVLIDGVEIWCGHLPNAYAAHWPTLVMMIALTICRNTGNTIMKAWQGISGTAIAVANLWVMELFYGECANNVMVWMDIILFYFVVLASGAATHTMVWAMNWHSFFMMAYLNPQKGEPSEFPMFVPYLDWDSPHVVALATSIVGAILAVIATLIPIPITLTGQVQDDAETIVTGAEKIWTEAIDYMCGAESSTKAYQIFEAVRCLNGTVSKVQGNLADSWWENFDMCGAARRRLLYAHIDDTAKRLVDVKVVMAQSLCMASFDARSRRIFGALEEEMHELKRFCILVLKVAVAGAADGDIDEKEHARLERTCKKLLDAQARLYDKYLHLAGGNIAEDAPSCSKDLMQELTFLFLLSTWADEVHRLAVDLRMLDRDLDEHFSTLNDVGRLGVAGFRHTFGVPGREKLKFAVRNTVTIGGSFIVGYSWGGRGMVFPAYSATMPATLSVLFQWQKGCATVQNLKRLLGVLLGRVGPLVLLSIVQVMSSYAEISHCGTWQFDLIIGVNTFVLAWFGVYVYFTSPAFAHVGLLMGAFGIGVLSGECRSRNDMAHVHQHAEVAQIVAAILISTFVDIGFELLFRSRPRDVAVRDIEEMNVVLHESYDAFFAGDVESAKRQMDAYKSRLDCAKSMVTLADPSQEFFVSYRCPFKLDLYKDSMGTYEALKAEMSVLMLATRGHSGAYSLLDYITGAESFGSLQREFQHVAQTVLWSLRNFLAHGAEDSKFQGAEATKSLIKVSGRSSLAMLDAAIADLNRRPLPARARAAAPALFEDPRVRVTTAMAFFYRSKVHLGELDKTLLKKVAL